MDPSGAFIDLRTGASSLPDISPNQSTRMMQDSKNRELKLAALAKDDGSSMDSTVTEPHENRTLMRDVYEIHPAQFT